jgi:hypothetical protein
MTRQKWQSGRSEVRRFGAGAPDRVPVQFRLLNEDAATFEHFFDRQANLGVNWFSAPWLATLGYPSHAAKIVGHPKRKGVSGRWSDYSVTLLVQEAAYVPDDTFWSSAGPGAGSGSGEETVEGLVVASGTSGTGVLVTELPAGLYATKVVCLRVAAVACALKADGTLRLWGDADYITSYLSGLASLGGIVDIAATNGGVLYLTSAGVVGGVGYQWSGELSPPALTGVTAIDSDNVQWGWALKEDGTIVSWGENDDTFISNPPYALVNGHCYAMGALDADGNLVIAPPCTDYLKNLPTFSTDIATVALCQNGGLAQLTDGSWQGWGHDNYTPSWNGETYYPPAGLVATDLRVGYRFALGLHTDGTLVGWGPYNYTPSSSLKFHSFAHPSDWSCVGILMED